MLGRVSVLRCSWWSSNLKEWLNSPNSRIISSNFASDSWVVVGGEEAVEVEMVVGADLSTQPVPSSSDSSQSNRAEFNKRRVE